VNRRAVAVVVLGTWVGAMGWLVRREFWRPRAEVWVEAGSRVPPGSAFYTLTMGGQQIGYASSTIDTTTEDIRLQDVLVVEVPALGALHRTDMRTDASLTRSLQLRSFTATVQGEAGRFRATGQVHGDTVLSAELESEGSRQQFRVPLERPIVLPAVLPLRVVMGRELEVGATYTVDMFDPMLLRERAVEVAVTGESTLVVPDSADSDSLATFWYPVRWDTLHAWRIEQRANGLVLESWVDDLGRVVSASSPVGFRMERTAYEIAYENFRKRDTAQVIAAGLSTDIIQQTAIAANVPAGRGDIEALRVVLSGADLAGFDLAGDRQELSGDTLTVQREGTEEIRARYRLGPQRLAGFEEWLDPEPLVQSDDERIRATARLIVGRVTDPRRAVELLNRWVYENVDKQITVSVPSAVQVLETRRGDCNEHTVLFVALARAAGIPARTAAGLVHLNGRFFYHAWPEVYLRGWVAVDPTFGQFPADAAHLRFTIGGLARQIELLRLIGRLDIDVIEAKGAA
jgi:transglutaminase-like putative cysteine protease